MSDLKSQRDTKPGNPEPKPSDRMPPGYCMFTCDKCGCSSRWYAPIEQEREPLKEIIADEFPKTITFDHWLHLGTRSHCSACAQTPLGFPLLPYVPEPAKAVKK